MYTETGKTSSYRGIWRILLAVSVIALIVLIALFANLKLIRDLLNSSGRFFADSSLNSALALLTDAENRLDRDPDSEPAHFDRAKAFILFGNLEGAREEWNEWHDRGTSDWTSIADILDDLEAKGDQIRLLLTEAEQSASPAENYPPIYGILDEIQFRYEGIPRLRALFLEGYLHLRNGDRMSAEQIFSESLDDYEPLREYVEYFYARSLIQEGREQEALDSFDRFISGFPGSRLIPLAHLERVNIYRDLDLMEDAISECFKVYEDYPESEFAPKSLRKIAEIHEENNDVFSGASIRALLLGDYPDSVESTETIEMFFEESGLYSPQIDGTSDNLTDYELLAVSYAAIDSYTDLAYEILGNLSESSELTDEQRAQACHGAARCQYAKWLYDSVIEWEQQAIAIAPDSEWAQRGGIRIGHAYWWSDNHDQAYDAYWDVVRSGGELGPLAAEIILEKAYDDQDDDTVREVMEYLAEHYPESDQAPVALTMLAFLELRDGNESGAVELAQRCIENYPDTGSVSEAMFWYAKALRDSDPELQNVAWLELARYAPWDFWGIRACEIINPTEDLPRHRNALDFNVDTLSLWSDSHMATAWELYETGILDLAESEFREAYNEGIPGSQSALALVDAETGHIRDGLLNLRFSAARGDESYLTRDKQDRILEWLYPLRFEEEVINAAMAHNVQPSLLWGAMRQESTYNPNARSGVGAMGLIQIMPGTARFIADQRGLDTIDVELMYDPAINLDYSAWYFNYLGETVGTESLMDILAAYNGGPGALRRMRGQLPTADNDIFINSIPNHETRNFAHWVYANVRMYERVLSDKDSLMAPF